MEVRVTAMGNENCGEICWVAAKLMNTTFDADDYFEKFSRSANARLFGVGFYPRCITLSSIRTSIVDYQKSIIPSPCIRSNQFCLSHESFPKAARQTKMDDTPIFKNYS